MSEELISGVAAPPHLGSGTQPEQMRRLPVGAHVSACLPLDSAGQAHLPPFLLFRGAPGMRCGSGPAVSRACSLCTGQSVEDTLQWSTTRWPGRSPPSSPDCGEFPNVSITDESGHPVPAQVRGTPAYGACPVAAPALRGAPRHRGI